MPLCSSLSDAHPAFPAPLLCRLEDWTVQYQRSQVHAYIRINTSCEIGQESAWPIFKRGVPAWDSNGLVMQCCINKFSQVVLQPRHFNVKSLHRSGAGSDHRARVPWPRQRGSGNPKAPTHGETHCFTHIAVAQNETVLQLTHQMRPMASPRECM